MTGETYVGQFLNDSRWGLGSAYYSDGGPKYIGPWVNGNPEGANGTLFFQSGQKYIGDFVQGSPEGQGILYGQDGSIIEEGPFGPDVVKNQDTNEEFTLPKMDVWGIDLTDNKYANLIEKIISFVKTAVKNNQETDSNEEFALPKMEVLGVDLMDNNYANLIEKIISFVKTSWPKLRESISFLGF